MPARAVRTVGRSVGGRGAASAGPAARRLGEQVASAGSGRRMSMSEALAASKRAGATPKVDPSAGMTAAAARQRSRGGAAIAARLSQGRVTGRSSGATGAQAAPGGRMSKWGKRAAVFGGAAVGAGFATRTGSGSDAGNRSLYGPGGMM